MMDMEGLDNCSICMDSYDEKLRPLNLPCGHTFCPTCINNTIKEEIIECPHCKVPHSALNARDFPVNFIAEAMISKFREAKLGADLRDNPESVLSATGTQLEHRKMQDIINALKESLRRLTEAAKTTKNESEKYKKCIGKKIAQHRDQMTEIDRILQIHKDIVNELEEMEQKLTKYSEEQELCLAAISHLIFKLDYTNESYERLIVCEKLVKLGDAIANLILRGDVINSIFARPAGLNVLLAPTNRIRKENLICAVQERDGRVYTANIRSENGQTYLHHLKDDEPSDNVPVLRLSTRN